MLMSRIKAELEWSDLVTVRLLRRWVAAREAHEHALASLVELTGELGLPPQVAVALGSLFQLTENCLGRPIEAECCCSRSIGSDERAILLMIALGSGETLPLASETIPHGLPAVLAWAVMSVRRVLREEQPFPRTELRLSRCPFERT
jgi:hypothetical protein